VQNQKAEKRLSVFLKVEISYINCELLK